MDAQKRDVSQAPHQSNLKRPWLGPNEHFDARTEFKNHSNSRAPERAREHLRLGISKGIISVGPTKSGSSGEPPSKKIRNSEYGLERHIFPRVYAPQGSLVHDRNSILDSKLAFLQPESSPIASNQSTSPPGDIGNNGQQQRASGQENGEKGQEKHQHKSLLITTPPNPLAGVKTNKASSASDSFRPATFHENSHDMQLDCNSLLQEVALGLSQLASILQKGKFPEEVELLPTKDHRGERSNSSVKCPDVARLGLKDTLRWMLKVVQSSTSSAQPSAEDDISPPPRSSPENERTAPAATDPEGPLEIMKRRFLDDDFRRQHPDYPSEDGRSSQGSRRDSVSRDSKQARRTTLTSGDELPPMKSHTPFPSSFSHTSLIGRTPAMNPPPAPNRPPPISPPGHLRLSPTSPYTLGPPASSSAYVNQPSNSISLPSPRSLSSSSLGNLFHHPLSPSSSILIDANAATNAHTAALQHDVSIRTLALQSLQIEHNNLLAAFSRSQTRAVALEKKHHVSDTEINTLSEEKVRLQTQVTELEQSVEELSRSRDEARQSAVQDGAQYVQMIKMAGQLEERTREERKAWEKTRGDLEMRMEKLAADAKERMKHHEEEQQQRHSEVEAANDQNPFISTTEAGSRKPDEGNPSGTEGKITPLSSAGAAALVAVTLSHQPSSSSGMDLLADLRNEIQSLRKRCAEFEQTLLVVRSESREIESVVAALGKAGKRIKEKVNESLVGLDINKGPSRTSSIDVHLSSFGKEATSAEVLDP